MPSESVTVAEEITIAGVSQASGVGAPMAAQSLVCGDPRRAARVAREACGRSCCFEAEE